MTAGASRTAPTIAPQPALAPSPQPRPAPTTRALPPGLVEQRGQNWTPIGGQICTPIDSDPDLRCKKPPSSDPDLRVGEAESVDSGVTESESAKAKLRFLRDSIRRKGRIARPRQLKSGESP